MEDKDTFVFYADTTELPERSAPNIRGRSFKILAEVEITDPDAQGVLFAHGSLSAATPCS